MVEDTVGSRKISFLFLYRLENEETSKNQSCLKLKISVPYSIVLVYSEKCFSGQ